MPRRVSNHKEGRMIPLELWPRYAAFWLPGCPPRGNPWDADYIFSLAFGRNIVIDNDLWRVGVEWGAHHFDDLATRKALLHRGFDPGAANVSLAAEASAFSERYDIPLVLQWEVYLALQDDWLEERPGMAFAIWPPAHRIKYWNSRDVAEDGLEIMRQRGYPIRRPALLAHRWHALRAYLLLRKVFGRGLILLPQETDVFDPASVQKHTTSREAWLKRDLLGRAHHVLRGLV